MNSARSGCLALTMLIWVWAPLGIAGAAPATHPAALSPKELQVIRALTCNHNLREIGLQIAVYANDHGDRTPPDLGTLAIAEKMDVPTFVCPASASTVPVRWKEMKPQEKADWINAHTDDIYLTPNKYLTRLASDRAVIAYERDDDHDGAGMNVLIGMEPVQFLSLDKVHQTVGKTAGTERKTTRVPLKPGQTIQPPLPTPDELRVENARITMATLETALDAFEVDVGRYPTEKEGLDALLQKPATNAGDWRGPYLKTVPLDPLGHRFVYKRAGEKGGFYEIRSAGPDGKLGTTDDISSR